ncbi:MAG: TolC family protein [Verrucomicrobiota bacterium]|nr:TolC family protein [Verrucomicrobiota bacterium]
MIKRCLVTLMVGLLCGCASMQPTDPYAPVEPVVRERDITKADPRHEVLRVYEGKLTLEQTIEIALANNPEVAARRWDTSAAEARRDQAYGERLPRIGFLGGYTHTLDEQRLIASRDGEPGVFSRDMLESDLVVSMPLYAGGRLVNQVDATDLLRQSTEHRLARSREELVFNVSSLFNGLLAQRHVIESLGFSQKTLTEHLSRVDALISAQKAATVDRMRTEVRLADIEQQLVRESNLQAIQQRALANLLGLMEFHGPIQLQGELETLDPTPVPTLEEALLIAWSSRGDYLSAGSSLKAQAKNLDIAKSRRLPTLLLQGMLGERWAAGSTVGAGEDRGEVGRVGLVLDIPIFEGGQIEAGIREQRSHLAAAQERMRQLALQVQLEVETALLNVESTAQRAAAIRKSIDQAGESLRIEQQKYDLGKGAIVDVLDAQDALLASETNYYRVLAEHHTAFAQLNLALGVE